MADHYRVGLAVPSSNTTMETEIPAMLRRREEVEPETFTFHSSRVRLRHVTKEELAEMVNDSDRCAVELSDAHVDVIAYACLVAIRGCPRSRRTLHGGPPASSARVASVTGASQVREDRRNRHEEGIRPEGRHDPGGD